MPNDAGLNNTIPSVPRPDQMSEDSGFAGRGGLGAGSIANAADNPIDIPRSHKELGATGEVITGTGDQMPAQVKGRN